MNTGQVMGIIFFLAAVLQILTGSLLTKSGSTVTRKNKPVIFWTVIVLYVIVGVIFSLGIKPR